jgi:hypothetical protein
MSRHIEDILGQVIDTTEQTAAAGEKDAGTGIVDKRFVIQLPLEQVERLAHAQVHDGVERLALDLFAGKAGVIL